MANLKIRIFESGGTQPDTTITIPLGILRFAKKVIPKQAISVMQREGIDIDEIFELSQKKDIKGTLVEIEEHKKNEKIIISIE